MMLVEFLDFFKFVLLSDFLCSLNDLLICLRVIFEVVFFHVEIYVLIGKINTINQSFTLFACVNKLPTIIQVESATFSHCCRHNNHIFLSLDNHVVERLDLIYMPVLFFVLSLDHFSILNELIVELLLVWILNLALGNLLSLGIAPI
jgi:hypothetical protein